MFFITYYVLLVFLLETLLGYKLRSEGEMKRVCVASVNILQMCCGIHELDSSSLIWVSSRYLNKRGLMGVEFYFLFLVLDII